MTVNIRHSIQLVFFAALCFSTRNAAAQDTTLNKYGLWIIRDIKTLKSTVIRNQNKKMVDLKRALPGILIDLPYNTKNNFMKKELYHGVTTTFLRLPAAKALLKAQNELNKLGYGLKIYDAYRPYSVTEKMWEPIKDERYVADPKKGSGHNRGASVDLTIIDLKTKKELAMGTGYDDFSDTAHHSFTTLPKDVLENRTLLKTVMEKYGFRSFETEWWHYNLPNARDFELLDISFKKLKKYSNSF